jgi:hypothetical protein
LYRFFKCFFCLPGYPGYEMGGRRKPTVSQEKEGSRELIDHVNLKLTYF